MTGIPAGILSMLSARIASSMSDSELAAALKACRQAFVAVALTSSVISLLYLTGSFFMLSVYDRVLPSRSVQTLVSLCVLAGLLYAFHGVLEVIRGRILVRIGDALDQKLGLRVLQCVLDSPVQAGARDDGLQPLRDLDQVRNFLSSLGLAALFDLPWLPIYIGICFLFHPIIGLTAMFGAILLVAFTLATERLTVAPAERAVAFAGLRNALASSGRRNAEAVRAMGMASRLSAIWALVHSRYKNEQRRIADDVGAMGAASKVFRLALQSGVLGIGAYLVINQQATAGIIIASSILVARALAPIELAIGHWKSFVAARQGWHRLGGFLASFPPKGEQFSLPPPVSFLSVEEVAVLPPSAQRPILLNVTFALEAGAGLGIIGPSASGKSSLARALVGAWAPVRGHVRLDGASLQHWSRPALGRHIGYLPQDIELFSGTVAQNISRFDAEPDSDAIMSAAIAADIHELILRMPNGYDTEIGEGGAVLSAGQRQRIALARALYKEPFLVVLDEPNSNLDAVGERALNDAIRNVRARGGIVVVIAHRPSALVQVDQIMILSDGQVQALGPKEEIFSKVLLRHGATNPEPAAASVERAASQPPVLRAVGAHGA